MTRSVRSAALALLTGSAGLSVLVGAAVAVPSAPAADQRQAVVAFTGAPPSSPGVRVETLLPSVGAAVVRGDVAALRRLASAPGVIAVRTDDPLAPTDDTLEPVLPPVRVDPLAEQLGGVLASRGLGSPAGTATAGAGIRVAVLDTGVSDTPALDRASGRLVDGVDTTPVRDGGEPSTVGPFLDGFGHGTFLASVLAGGPVAGSQGRALGVAPGATVVVVKVAPADGSTSLSQVLAGLDWVIAHRAEVDVVNVSLAAELPTGDYAPDPLVVAIERVRQAGIVPVVAAGNEPGVVGDPGFAPSALTVGAADALTREVNARSGSALVAGFRKPDVVANGHHVLGVLPPASVLAEEHPSAHLAGGLWRGSGTSQAAAVVSGVSALVLQQWPASTPDQVKAFLHANAADLPGEADGSGLVQRPSSFRSPASSALVQPLTPGGPGPGSADGPDNPWAASSWSASSWSASSWSASSWSASSWSASSWSSSWAAGDQ